MEKQQALHGLGLRHSHFLGATKIVTAVVCLFVVIFVWIHLRSVHGIYIYVEYETCNRLNDLVRMMRRATHTNNENARCWKMLDELRCVPVYIRAKMFIHRRRAFYSVALAVYVYTVSVAGCIWDRVRCHMTSCNGMLDAANVI